ncbi:hypothetical protein [Leptospira kobayashii]|uniref:hypothetical protein n=1 Tax=Leptospira kobayashii TaxID=1917830 RepID=UPI00107F2348|nr:hypothetical protein [Leptospira kobayashii]
MTTQTWMKEGFSLRESMQLASEFQKGKEEFRKWIQTKQKKEQSRIHIILKKHNISLYSNVAREKTHNNKQLKENSDHPKLQETSGPTQLEKDYFFIGGSYQNLDTRYLPKSEKNHSGFYVGRKGEDHKIILEKRDERFSGSLSYFFSYFQMNLGNRYKPIPHFYFAKDPDFYSAFDRTDSPLTQPILNSYFLGINSKKKEAGHKFGIYHSQAVSPEPGIYYTSPNQSYSFTWAPYSRIGSIYINDSYKNLLGWDSNLQGEAMGRTDQFYGFLYARSEKKSWELSADGTLYRDFNGVLSLPMQNMVDQTGVRQDLQFGRLRWKKYFVLEGLQSKEGLRYESGIGGHFPILFGDWGAVVFRYRDYTEEGFNRFHAVGRGLFYEFRKDKNTISIGGEVRTGKQQFETKLSFPLQYGYLLEISGIYRDKKMEMRSWFENWSYAADYNVNLMERNELWKLKLVGPEFSLNLSLSQKTETVTYIYYANLQFLLRF